MLTYSAPDKFRLIQNKKTRENVSVYFNTALNLAVSPGLEPGL